MFLRIQLLEPTLSSGSICGTPETPIDLTDVQLVCKINGQAAIAIVDVSVQPNPVNIGFIDNVTYGVDDIDNTNGIIKLSFVFEFDKITTIESQLIINNFQFEIEINKFGYTSYKNVFTIYNQDLGNDVTTLIYNNPEFKIYMPLASTQVAGSELPHAAFISIPKPYSTLVNIYNASSAAGARSYSDADSLVSFGVLSNVIIDVPEDTNVNLKLDVLANGVTCSVTTVQAGKLWFPKYNLTVHCVDCGGECINIVDNNEAIAGLDFSGVYEPKQHDLVRYPGRYFKIIYLLYDEAGQLIDFETFNFEALNSSTFTFNPVTYTWNFIPPDAGRYLIKLAVGVYGVNGTTFDETATLNQHTWYKFISGDWTELGAIDNATYEAFWATSTGVITSGAGTVKELTVIKECYTHKLINACDFYSIVKDTTTCGTYTINNNSSATLTLTIDKWTNGAFADYNDLTYTLLPYETLTISLSDGLYDFVIIKTIDSVPDPEIHVIFPVECAIQTCGANKLKDLLCHACICKEECGDLCKKYYDFNAYIILLHSWTLLNKETFNANRYYELLDADLLKQVGEAQQVMDKLVEYCTACPTDC